MRRFALWVVSAALLFGTAAVPASADVGQGGGASATARAHATVLAKQLKCGGAELRCPGKLVKVCNPQNGKCCCATAGTYR
jgi:hypothetical protein